MLQLNSTKKADIKLIQDASEIFDNLVLCEKIKTIIQGVRKVTIQSYML